MVEIWALLGLLVYFIVLLWAVSRQRKMKDANDFFFAGRRLPYWALSITFVASWWGAGSALSTADLAYSDGMGAFCYYGLPVLLSTFLMILGAGIIRKVGWLTQGDMMKARYSALVAKSLSVMVVAFMVMNAAAQMVGIGKFFGTYLGLSYHGAIVVGVLIVLVYSMMGGFSAVVLTDVIQFVLLTLAALVVLGYGWMAAGGWAGISGHAVAVGRPELLNMFADLPQYAAYIITFAGAWTIQANVWQRISAARHEKDARRMAVMSFFAYIPLYMVVVLTGMAAFVLYDKLPSGGVIVAITKDYMSAGVAALVFIGISAAIMSTMDSLINTGAMTLVLDFKRWEDGKKVMRLSRVATLGITLVAYVIAAYLPSILQISWLASDLITSCILVPLVMGFVWKRGTAQGALASILGGSGWCIYNFLLFAGCNLPKCWEGQSVQQVAMGLGLSLVLYVGGSWMSKAQEENYERLRGECAEGMKEE